MDKSVRVYHSLDEMKADEYRYWQSRPVHERMDAVSEMTLAAYATQSYAVSFHTQPRTEDLDVFIKADAANAAAAFQALTSFGAPLTGITVDDLANPGKFFGSAGANRYRCSPRYRRR
jgi:hypothetical protein